MSLIRFLPALAALLVTLTLALTASLAQGQTWDQAKLLRVEPGKHVVVPLDPRAHGAVVAVRATPVNRRVPPPKSVTISVNRDRAGRPLLRIAAGRDATPAGPYRLDGQDRKRRTVRLPFQLEVVSARPVAKSPQKSAAPRQLAAPRQPTAAPSDRRQKQPVASKPTPGATRTAPVAPSRTAPVVQRDVVNRRTKPSGRALLILLENDGLRSSLNAIGLEVSGLPQVPYIAYPKGADPEDQVKFLLLKNESIPQALSRLSNEIAALAEAEDSDVFADVHGAACNLLPTSATRVLAQTCNPRQDCMNLTPNNPACALMPTSAPCPATGTYSPRQECLDNPPNGPTLQAAMLQPMNWDVQLQEFGDWLDATSDFLIEEIAKVAKHQAAFANRYDQVVVLEDHRVKPEIAIGVIKDLSRRHTVDIHVLTHGSTNRIVGVSGPDGTHDFTDATFFRPLREAREALQPVWIRSVYQMNCNSGTLIDEWQSVGASVVSGTLHGDVSNYMPQQYIPFVNYWLGNASFATATAQAFQQARFVSEDFYAVLSGQTHLMEHSKQQVAGVSATRVTQ